MADYTISIDSWWTDTQELDEDFVILLIENNTPASPTTDLKKYELTDSSEIYREYFCKWDGLEFTIKIEVV